MGGLLKSMIPDRLPMEIVRDHTRNHPVDLDALAADLDLRVIEARLPPDISGKIERDIFDGHGFMVTLNAAHSPVRKRFTLAHEIAHFILHTDLIGDGIVDNALYRDGRLGDEKEWQANRFAASILMPAEAVGKAWRAGATDAARLAAAFGVSTAVAEIRMRELGCVLWPKP